MTAPPRPIPQAKQAFDRFLAFQHELVQVKAAAALIPAGDPVEKCGPAEDGETDQAAPVAPHPRPVDLFLRLRTAVCPQGRPPPAVDGVPDIGYVMAAMADEAMIHQVDWPGRDAWVATLVEQSLYGSRVAGDEIFDMAQALMDGEIAGRADLAAAILIALSLGFRGRHHGVSDDGAIDALRAGLYEIVYNQPLPQTMQWASPLGETVEPVLDSMPMQRLPRLFPWVAAICVLMVAVLAASAWIWSDATRPLLDMALQIRKAGLGGNAGGGP